jgi:hypothetical protein
MGEQFTVKSEEEKAQESSPKKSGKKFCVGCFLSILLFIAFLVLASFYIFNNFRKPMDLGVSSSPEDFDRFIAKTGLQLDSDPSQLCFTCPVEYSGKKQAGFRLTNEEVSAWFNSVNAGMGLISGTQIKIESNKVSIQTNFNYYGKSYPVFASGKISKLDSQSVKIRISQVRLGKIPIPGNFTPKIEEVLNDFTNQKLAEIDNFEIEELEFQDGFLHFKGSLPEKVTAS